MHRLALALAIVASVTLPGCLDSISNPFDPPAFHTETLHSRAYGFSYAGILNPEDPPSGPETAYQAGTDTFEVPPGAVALTVDYAVTFRNPGPQQPPQDAQEVRVSVEGPGPQERANASLVTDGRDAWSFEDPHPGPWTLKYRARGEGTLFLLAVAIVEGEGQDPSP